MNDPDARGPSPFENRRRGGRLRATVRHLNALYQQRHCERSEAIQSLSAVGFWIASAFAKASADKSLSLAMMEWWRLRCISAGSLRINQGDS
ncbi:hypothetical protein I6F21_15530 [Bradyrhizobium sp. NBAIM03]|uniref:Uncharacterized protein n=1 Tax=Bradyrhizobium yuanmingense TaxID=108015 RepID=A0A1C3XBU1_9BRAD|nr:MULTISPECIES: hypothetical protein [Bradyrhizobium]MCA1383678.1 hypothetical protein [Bradyrhizobium sp. BRP05]MCA1417917.1 hypothetical protein [Bradyrhizobium sp. BRP23]MCA1533964.1 hypothetical protein [Bradyrhizobium sp. NBAIM03]TWI20451.1 hypothetical protein IQ15_06391 [Bradyrhizobium yuanmingense]SCB49760.1 hypothetical protein GA0061099_1011150 [Bradyrhizobium yuanmingense]